MTMNETSTLADVSEFIVDCLHNTAPIQEDGYPLIRTPNIGKGRLILDKVFVFPKKHIWFGLVGLHRNPMI